jgi:hypothetical protein
MSKKECNCHHCQYIRKQNNSIDNEMFVWFIIFYSTAIFWIPINTIRYFFWQFIKPFKVNNKEIMENKKNFINGNYNPCEYVFSNLF